MDEYYNQKKNPGKKASNAIMPWLVLGAVVVIVLGIIVELMGKASGLW